MNKFGEGTKGNTNDFLYKYEFTHLSITRLVKTVCMISSSFVKTPMMSQEVISGPTLDPALCRLALILSLFVPAAKSKKKETNSPED